MFLDTALLRPFNWDTSWIVSRFFQKNGLRAHRAKLTPRRRPEPLSFEEVEKELREALIEYPPPSISEVARRVGRHMSTLESKFSQLYHQVVARRSAHGWKAFSDVEAEALLKEAVTKEPPPSLQSIFRRLGCQGGGFYYYERFPGLCIDITARYKEHRNKPFDMNEAQRILEAARVEEPPPSFSEIARRLNHSREFVRTKFTELSEAIASRYMEYRKNRREENKKILLQEVEAAVCSVSSEGLYVSEARVKAQLSRQLNSRTFKQALREAKRKLGLME